MSLISLSFTYAADGTKLKSGYVTFKEVSAVQPARANAFLPDSLRFGGGLLDSTRVIGPGTGRTFWLREVNTVTYAGNYEYENDTLSKKFFADGYIDCSGDEPVACFYLKDHLGNVRMVVDENGKVVQVNDYYPFGALYGSGTGDAAQRYKYNGKELERMPGLDWYDYGARWMDPVLCRFTTMDPFCEKYYDTSPYAYCANNPMNRTDPTGMKWEDEEEARRLTERVQDKIDDLSAKKEKLTLRLANNNLRERQISRIGRQMDLISDRIGELNGSLSDIEMLGNDEAVYAFSNPADGSGMHHVRLGDNGIVYIETSSTDLSLHEIRHVAQSLENGGLKFSESMMLKNAGGHDYRKIANMEIEAYKRQYAYELNFPGQLNGQGLDGINAHSVGNLKIQDTFIYPEIKKYSDWLLSTLKYE